MEETVARCPNCHHILLDTDAKCYNCAFQRSYNASQSQPNSPGVLIFCSKCGAGLAPDAAFCSKCGAPTAPAPAVAAEKPNVYCVGCGHVIPEQHSKCHHCGSPRPEGVLPLAPNAIDQLQIVGYAGAALLLVGSFAPIVSAPIVGNVTMFSNGSGMGVLLLIGAVIAGIFSYIRRYEGVSLIGLVSGLLLLYAYWNFRSAMSNMGTSLRDNPFGEIAMASVQMQWGWGVLILGTLLLFSTAIIDVMQKQNRPV